MRDLNKGKFHLVDEVTDLRKQVADLKQSGIERRRIEDGLRRERELLQALLDTAPVSLCLLASTGQPLLVNQAFARLLGYGSPGELVRLSSDLGLFVAGGSLGGDRTDAPRSDVSFRRKDGTALTASVLWSTGTGTEPQALAVLEAVD